MAKSSTNIRFHGLKVISDQNCVSVKNNYVVETNSEYQLICRYYDKNGLAEDNPIIIDIMDFLIQDPCTESNIIGSIKHQVRKPNILISKSAVDLIKIFASE